MLFSFAIQSYLSPFLEPVVAVLQKNLSANLSEDYIRLICWFV